MVGGDDKRMTASEVNIYLDASPGVARVARRRTSRAGGGIEGRGPERRSAILFLTCCGTRVFTACWITGPWWSNGTLSIDVMLLVTYGHGAFRGGRHRSRSASSRSLITANTPAAESTFQRFTISTGRHRGRTTPTGLTRRSFVTRPTHAVACQLSNVWFCPRRRIIEGTHELPKVPAPPGASPSSTRPTMPSKLVAT